MVEAKGILAGMPFLRGVGNVLPPPLENEKGRLVVAPPVKGQGSRAKGFKGKVFKLRFAREHFAG